MPRVSGNGTSKHLEPTMNVGKQIETVRIMFESALHGPFLPTGTSNRLVRMDVRSMGKPDKIGCGRNIVMNHNRENLDFSFESLRSLVRALSAV